MTALETVHAFLETVFTPDGYQIDKIDDYIAADCLFHDLPPGQQGREGYKGMLAMLSAATEEEGGAKQPVVFGAGEYVAVRWVNPLKHTGELFGVPATGRVFTGIGHDLYRLRDGKIVEFWSVMDLAGIMRQLTAE